MTKIFLESSMEMVTVERWVVHGEGSVWRGWRPYTFAVQFLKKESAFVVLFAIAIALAFGGAALHGFSAVDDSFLIVENLAVVGPSLQALKLAWTTYDPELYIPATITSYHLDFLVHHITPFWMHFEDLLLHFLNAVLVWLLLRKWTDWKAGAVIGALLFSIHPIQTEAVVWLSARKDLLMTAFSLGSLLLFEKYLTAPRLRLLVFSALLFALALLSKPSAILLPMVMTMRMTMVRGGEWRRYGILAPFAVLSIVAMVIGVLGKSHIVGLRDPFITLGLAAQSVLWTAGKLILVVPLRVSYDLLQTSSMTMIIGGVFTLALLWIAYRCWKKNAPLIMLGILWFLTLLAPSLLNTRIGGIPTLAADRYAYLPVIGIVIALVAAGESFLRSKNSRKIVIVIASVFCLICIGISYKTTGMWQSAESLFSASLERQPSAVSTRIALVRTLQDQGKTQQAFNVLKEGLRFGDDARLHLAAGYIYVKTGDVESAKEQFGLAMAMDDTSPDGYYAMGALLRQTQDTAGARQHLEKAIAIDESFVEARIELAKILIAEGKREEARNQLMIALEWNPSNREASALMESL